MKMKPAYTNKILLFAVVAVLAAGPVTAKEASKSSAPEIIEDISVIPARIVIPEERAVLARAAAGILRHIADARGAIYEKNPKAALENLKKIDKQVSIIKAGRPVAVIKDHVWVAKKHLDYENSTEVAADLIPIYADLTALEDFVPVEQATKHLDKAREHLKKGDRQAAKEELAAVDEAMTYTEVDLPLAETEHQVARAREFLARNKLQDADKALKAAEDGVQVLSIGVEGPLVMAQRSLQRARKNHVVQKDAAARSDLKNASAWIDRAEQSTDKGIREKAAELGASLKKLEQQLKE